MAHEDRGNYAKKHEDRQRDPAIITELTALAQGDRITCSAAHKAAKHLNVPPEEVGVQADLMELRIIECQLGLFGHDPAQKKLDPAIDISDELWTEIETRGQENRLSCRECWDIARDFKISRMHMGSACEKIDIRIKPCQLGSF